MKVLCGYSSKSGDNSGQYNDYNSVSKWEGTSNMWLGVYYYYESESCSVISESLRPHGLYTVHGIFQARILEWVAFPFSRGFSNSGIQPGSPTLQADSLPAELPGKPMCVCVCILKR